MSRNIVVHLSRFSEIVILFNLKTTQKLPKILRVRVIVDKVKLIPW
jgi:hypothetical protein